MTTPAPAPSPVPQPLPGPTHPTPTGPGRATVCPFRWVGAPNRLPKKDTPDHACALPPGHQPRGGDHVCICGASHPADAPRRAAA